MTGQGAVLERQANAKIASLDIQDTRNGTVVFVSGDWQIGSIGEANDVVLRAENMAAAGRLLTIDFSAMRSIDTSGAWVFNRLAKNWFAKGGDVHFEGRDDFTRRLMDAAIFEEAPTNKGKAVKNAAIRTLETLGRLMFSLKRDTELGLNVIGAAIRGPQMKLGRRGGIRPISIVHHIDRMGLRAVPIIVLMSFLIGAIVAQQSAFQLRFFGLEVWAVDLVGVLLLREIGVLLTAIMIAGRSGSAMTAEIGSMKMREEVDALTVIGLNPIGVLVFPRLVALTVALPLLTFIANMAALAGAAFVLRFYSGIALEDFIGRLRGSVDLSTVFSGLIKAPFMALIIGTMAAVEGMKVEGSAESLGRRTTAAVVKAIFFVVVVDGLFAIFYAAIDY